jgi:hypothetical protein
MGEDQCSLFVLNKSSPFTDESSHCDQQEKIALQRAGLAAAFIGQRKRGRLSVDLKQGHADHLRGGSQGFIVRRQWQTPAQR